MKAHCSHYTTHRPFKLTLAAGTVSLALLCAACLFAIVAWIPSSPESDMAVMPMSSPVIVASSESR